MSQPTDAGVVPEIYMDEITPPPRATPDDWILRRGDAFSIAADDEFAGCSSEHQIKHGEAVAFGRLTTYPYATLTFAEDGEWTCEPPAPEDAESLMVVGDPESMTDSVAELVGNLRADGGGDAGETYDLLFFTWTSEIWSFDAEAGKFTRGAA